MFSLYYYLDSKKFNIEFKPNTTSGLQLPTQWRTSLNTI